MIPASVDVTRISATGTPTPLSTTEETESSGASVILPQPQSAIIAPIILTRRISMHNPCHEDARPAVARLPKRDITAGNALTVVL